MMKKTTNSTRRFFSRPAWVALLVVGCEEPKPL
jgi:hypothetical protein